MKHRGIPRATLTTLSISTIYTLVQRFCQQHPLPPKRGRPPKYPEPLILTLLLIAVREHASYRRLRFALATELLPNQPLPALGTRVYWRVSFSNTLRNPEGVQKNEMSIEGGRQVHLTKGTLWLGQSCPSVYLQGQACPCYAIFRTPSETLDKKAVFRVSYSP